MRLVGLCRNVPVWWPEYVWFAHGVHQAQAAGFRVVVQTQPDGQHITAKVSNRVYPRYARVMGIVTAKTS